MAKAKAKAKKKPGKKNPELPGTERPTNKAMDEFCSEHIEALEEMALWKEKAKVAHQKAEDEMKRNPGDFEKNVMEEPTYAYFDGETKFVVTLENKQAAKFHKQKRTEMKPEDEGGEIG